MARWKPKNKDWYYYIKFNKVNSVPWYEEDMDYGNWEMGNCFRTEEQAEKALEKLRETLIEFHKEQSNA